MSLVKTIRQARSGVNVIIHASNKRNFRLIARMAQGADAALGIYAVAPPSHQTQHAQLSCIVGEQLDELAPLLPAGTSLYLVGDCLAGHMTLTMAGHLTSDGCPPAKVVLLDTTPTYLYFDSNTAFNVLKLPGEVRDFGDLGTALIALDAGLEQQRLTPGDWVRGILAAVYQHQPSLADALARIAAVHRADGDELAELYLNWARLISITLTSPGVDYPGPVTLLASLEAATMPLLSFWEHSLPNVVVRETQTPHADIILSPALCEVLAVA